MNPITMKNNDNGQTVVTENQLEEFQSTFRGDVFHAGTHGYDTVRKIWNGMFDRKPGLVARCVGTSDVIQAVNFGREYDLEMSVKGGGHNSAGTAVTDGGLMIDLSLMRRVTVDKENKTARVDGGCLLGDVDYETQLHGLAVSGGIVSHTGVGGLALGGGFGWISRKHGLSVDNMISAEVVTAKGELVTASATENADLFWGIRGGGGNFGVATGFEFQLHPFERNVLSGSIVWPYAQARDVLEFYAEWAEKLSDEMYVGPTTATTPDGDRVIMMDVVYNGDPAAGEKELAPLRAIGTPIADGVVAQDYTVLQTNNDVAFGHGVRSYAKNGMVKQWSQQLVDAMVENDDPRIFIANHVAGGAVKRVGELDTAFPHRNAEIMIVVVAGWMDAAQDDELIAACRDYYKAIEPSLGGYYSNIDYDHTAARGNYGPAYERLAQIKGQYDPDNLFRLNSNIAPA